MFGLGMPEILLILAIALIVIGPKKLPDLAKTLGRAMGEFKRSAQDFKKSLEVETSLKDFKEPVSDLKSIIKDVNQKNTPSDDVPDKAENQNTRTDEASAPDLKIPDSSPDQEKK